VKKTTIVIVILMLVTTALAVFADEPPQQSRSGENVYSVDEQAAAWHTFITFRCLHRAPTP
jgi:hypothetical protein